MKFTATILALAATAVALPQIGHGGDHKGPQGDGVGNANGATGNGAGNGIGNQGNSQTRFRAPEDMTVQQASKKCGDNMQLSCCNKETAAGDTTDIPDGPLADALKGVLGGAGSGSEGLGLLEQCGKLDIIPIISDLINKHCDAKAACCQDSGSSADNSLIGLNLPCIALTSLI
ncbi:conidial hydrophobin Hyp1/RodA [Aspergillus terreus]|uniref:Hydrophobin n=1 Tax=Aspergillus terreus TaxID=33178 RepID=A0A5M3Z630_ASPTE|nr:hypothetical protein ATETN484_0010025200 [Aspergillus terreus]GFF18299.1 conidial hydrophobin Hyp1/RodA [Aspergillus terreus]